MVLRPVVGGNYFVNAFLYLLCAGIYCFLPSLLSVIIYFVLSPRPVLASFSGSSSPPCFPSRAGCSCVDPIYKFPALVYVSGNFLSAILCRR